MSTTAITRARTITDPTTATPRRIDTALMYLDDVIQAAQMTLADKDQEARHPQAQSTLDAARAEFTRLDAEHDRRGWTRYLTVQAGHVHSEYRCKGLKWSTRRFWHPELAGKSVPQAIAELGTLLCTHCFPDAPVAASVVTDECPGSRKMPDPTRPVRSGYVSGNFGSCPECGTRITLTKLGYIRSHLRPEVAAAKKNAELAARLGDRAITNPDGSTLYSATTRGDGVVDDHVILTEESANRTAMSTGFDLAYYSATYSDRLGDEETFRRCVAALAHKRGTTVADEVAAIVVKVDAKLRRMGARNRRVDLAAIVRGA